MALARRIVLVTVLFAYASAVALDSYKRDSSCDCLNWKRLYSNTSTQCGMGLEYADKLLNTIGTPSYVRSYTLDGFAAAMPDTLEDFVELAAHHRREWHVGDSTIVCDDFYTQLDTNMCVKVASGDQPTQWYGRNWCYVDATCTAAETATIPHFTKVQVKLCKDDEPSLGDLSPPQLYSLGKKMKLRHPEFVVKHAYPAQPWYYKDVSLHTEAMETISKSGKTVVFNDFDPTPLVHDKSKDEEGEGHVNRVFVKGRTVWTASTDGTDSPSMYTEDRLKCIENCNNMR